MAYSKKPYSRRKFVQVAGGVTAAGAIAGCIGDDEEPDPGEPDPDEEQFIQIGIASDPRTLDPIEHLSTPDRMVLQNVFDYIIGLDNDLGFVPELAVDLPETERDGQRWIFEIEPDATFHNGDPVTISDVEYSLSQPVVEERGDAGLYSMIDEFTEVDEHTLQIDLDAPYARFMLSLNSFVVPEAVREENKDANNDWNDGFVGSGPFEFVQWVEGDQVLLEKHDDWWRGIEPNLDEVEFNEIQEASTRVTTLQTGESDLIEEPPGDLFSTVRDMDNADLSTVPGLRCNFIAFNCIDGPTADLRVREGIDYCLDLDAEVETIHGEAAERMFSPIPPLLADEWDLPMEEWEEIPHDKDISMAQELFEDAGLDPDYEIKILVSGPTREEEAVSIRNGIEEAGYTASVTNLEWGTFISTFNSGSADDMNIYLLGLSGAPDPGAFINTLYHPNREGADNGHYYRDDELLEWMEQSDLTDDREERRELFINSITRVLEQRVHIPTHVPQIAWGIADHVQDYTPNPRPSENPRLVTHEQNVSVTRE